MLCAALSSGPSRSYLFAIDVESARDLFEYVQCCESHESDRDGNNNMVDNSILSSKNSISEEQFFGLMGLLVTGVRSSRSVDIGKATLDIAHAHTRATVENLRHVTFPRSS